MTSRFVVRIAGRPSYATKEALIRKTIGEPSARTTLMPTIFLAIDWPFCDMYLIVSQHHTPKPASRMARLRRPSGVAGCISHRGGGGCAPGRG